MDIFGKFGPLASVKVCWLDCNEFALEQFLQSQQCVLVRSRLCGRELKRRKPEIAFPDSLLTCPGAMERELLSICLGVKFLGQKSRWDGEKQFQFRVSVLWGRCVKNENIPSKDFRTFALKRILFTFLLKCWNWQCHRRSLDFHLMDSPTGEINIR